MDQFYAALWTYFAPPLTGLSRREASRQFGIDRKTVAKILLHSEPPGYRRRQPPKRPKLAPFTDIIDGILEEDRTVHRKQRHTAKRIFERLRDAHGFTGKQTIVKDYVRERHLGLREMFVPLAHPPGHAEADFGEADAIIAGVMHRAHFFVMTLPHSDACFVAAYPAATAEAWLDGHNAAFAFFGGVPQSILYDNDKCLVSRILPDGTRQRTRSFSGLQSHYLFEDRYGRPGKGNDKGNVEGVVGYARRNFMVPRPRFASWDTFNAPLEEQCRNRQGEVVRGHRETIGERLRRDCEALMVLPPAPFDACDRQGTRVSSLSLVRYRTNDYSVPVAYGHREVWIRGYVHEVVIGCDGTQPALLAPRLGRGFVGASLTFENGGDKVVHGSDGNLPAAGGAKVCLSLLLILPGVEIQVFPGDADSVGRLHMILLHGVLSEFRSRAARQPEIIAPRRRNQRNLSLGHQKYRGFCAG